VDVLLLDLAKVFDKVPHLHLKIKLISCGINEDLVGWISAFLTDKTKRVKVFTNEGKSILSERCGVTSAGVLQGSVLGPTVFNINTKDIFQLAKNHLTLYANDSKSFVQ
jgi:hypothetical protein